MGKDLVFRVWLVKSPWKEEGSVFSGRRRERSKDIE